MRVTPLLLTFMPRFASPTTPQPTTDDGNHSVVRRSNRTTSPSPRMTKRNYATTTARPKTHIWKSTPSRLRVSSPDPKKPRTAYETSTARPNNKATRKTTTAYPKTTMRKSTPPRHRTVTAPSRPRTTGYPTTKKTYKTSAPSRCVACSP